MSQVITSVGWIIGFIVRNLWFQFLENVEIKQPPFLVV
jgi:hypothetical protein